MSGKANSSTTGEMRPVALSRRWYWLKRPPPSGKPCAATCWRRIAARGSTVLLRPWLASACGAPGPPVHGGQAAHPSSMPTSPKPRSLRLLPAGMPLIGREPLTRPRVACSSTASVMYQPIWFQLRHVSGGVIAMPFFVGAGGGGVGGVGTGGPSQI